MVDDSNKNKKGFSGLSSMVSKVDDTKKDNEKKTDSIKEHSEEKNINPPTQSQSKPKSSSTSSKPIPESNQSFPTGLKLFLGIVGFIVFIGILSNLNDDNSKRNYSSSTNNYKPHRSQSMNDFDKFQESPTKIIPRIKTENLNTTNVKKVQSLLKDLGYDVGVIDGILGIKTENAIKNYQRDIGANQDGKITYELIVLLQRSNQPTVNDAIAAAERLLNNSSKRNNIVSNPLIEQKNTTSSNQIASQKSKKEILEVQSLLKSLGLDPGPIDGIYGEKTKKAIKQIQKAMKISEDDQSTEILFYALYQKKDDILSKLKELDNYNASNLNNAKNLDEHEQSIQKKKADLEHKSQSYLTRGSHKNDVIRIQGAPSEIDAYPASGYEVWHYGNSTIQISNRSKCVTEWDNEGNLKIKWQPGPNITNSTHLSRNSHQDDVLRLQGTPSEIDAYPASGYEVWHYGKSTVQISNRSKCVTEWDNEGNLNIKWQPGLNTTNSTHLSRNSHQDDVLRLQGTPSEIDAYPASGYEVWHYGNSTIQISIQYKRVSEWDNEGELKVAWSPGPNTTNSTYFSRNSHQDDVLRLQGTPSEIDAYPASSYEVWHYGSSSIRISRKTQTVLDWDNRGKLKIKK